MSTRTQAQLLVGGPMFSGIDCPNCGTPYAVCAGRVRRGQGSCCPGCFRGHKEERVDGDVPYDQQIEEGVCAVEEVLLTETYEHLPRRPDGSVDITAMVAQGTRKAVLNVLTRKAIAEARAALLNPWKWAGREDALEILAKASLRYEQYGGDLHPWGTR